MGPMYGTGILLPVSWCLVAPWQVGAWCSTFAMHGGHRGGRSPMSPMYRNARSGVFLDPMYGIQVQVSRYLMAPWCNFCHGRAHGLEALEAHLKTLRQASAYIYAC